MLQTDLVGDVSVISVHDELEPIHFSISSVVPSRYDIPGINANKEAFDACKFTFPGQKPFKYALRRTLNNRAYVMIKIVEPKTFIYGTEQQKVDEYGQRLSPDVMRVPVPQRVELVANEIERGWGNMGIKAIKGPVTVEILDQLERLNNEFLRVRVQTTNRWAVKNPNNVTAEARRSAWTLHKRGLLEVMPSWAILDPDAEGMAASKMFNCRNCKKLIPADTIRCSCGMIHDWKGALEGGFIKPADVPSSKRAEAGLEGAVVEAPAVQAADEGNTNLSLPVSELAGVTQGTHDQSTGLGNTSAAELAGLAAQMQREESPIFDDEDADDNALEDESEHQSS